jgi:allophanate hydrolase
MFVVQGPLPRPGLTRTTPSVDCGPGIEVEVWRLPAEELGGFLATIAPPLAIGPIELADGTEVLGFVCTADAVDTGREITAYGSWRNYLAAGLGT